MSVVYSRVPDPLTSDRDITEQNPRPPSLGKEPVDCPKALAVVVRPSGLCLLQGHAPSIAAAAHVIQPPLTLKPRIRIASSNDGIATSDCIRHRSCNRCSSCKRSVTDRTCEVSPSAELQNSKSSAPATTRERKTAATPPDRSTRFL
ncbi:hypothetical protein L596_013632 [Steinernema carpocapsae]|uniref:Uncharacterized protein n=1 Tax=Steinernema carpocapsae TaxID=34508 RepID=A0A4U5P0S6_STECR|nr:hypothetical protein L596_013632 [Steinernema carpocapsae]